MSISVKTSRTIPAGVLLSFSLSQRSASAMEMIGSLTVMIARTGAMRVPCWNAFSLSRKPSGPTTASA
jgi:hypothetical protein